VKPRILDTGEIKLLKKLCKPESFAPTAEEAGIVTRFLQEKIVKAYGPDKCELEVTDFGADCYAETLNHDYND
jgi:hypothetical protein